MPRLGFSTGRTTTFDSGLDSFLELRQPLVGHFGPAIELLEGGLGDALDAGQPVQLAVDVRVGEAGLTSDGARELGIAGPQVALVLVARHGGMRVLGISAITNMALAESNEPVNHEEVLAVAEELRPRFLRLMRGLIARIGM